MKNNISDLLDIISQKSQYISQIGFCSRDNDSTVFPPAIYAIVNCLFAALYPIFILANIWHQYEFGALRNYMPNYF